MTEKGTKTPHIVISDREPGLPYSKGLMASQVMVTGLSPFRAYQVAEEIEERLRERGSTSLTTDELSQLALEVLTETAGDRYAKNFLRWREVEKLDVPLVILIGGATGVGKSTHRDAAGRASGHRPVRGHGRHPRGHAVDVLARADAHAPHVVVRGRRGAPRAADQAGRPADRRVPRADRRRRRRDQRA